MKLQIDVSGYIKQTLHPLMLTMFNIQWMEALLYPLRNLLFRFYAGQDSDIYNLGHNGQVCYLRGMLNDAFDADLRRITITDTYQYNYVDFYPEADDKAVYFDTVLFAQESFIGTNLVDFNVNVPVELRTSDGEKRMRSLINYYKLVSKRYAIVYV